MWGSEIADTRLSERKSTGIYKQGSPYMMCQKVMGPFGVEPLKSICRRLSKNRTCSVVFNKANRILRLDLPRRVNQLLVKLRSYKVQPPLHS